jgi:DNA-directed RNA polymerase subunit RPC12/RpoP
MSAPIVSEERKSLAALEQGRTYDELHAEFGHHKAALIKEAAASVRLEAFLTALPEDLAYYWRWGDGQGGWLLDRLAAIVIEAGEYWPFAEPADPSRGDEVRRKKRRIPRRLAKLVFERDAYRCVTCGAHIDLTVDHIVPESKGGPTTLENLQTMCRSCNSKKGARL